MRDLIICEVESICPLDSKEALHKQDCLDWIESGAKLCRTRKPDTPPKHLVSYFVLVDGNHILLVDHKKALLWLPTGGHVEYNEHPKETVRREAQEELNIRANFLFDEPLFLTVTETVGLAAGHIDVSLWYVLKGSRKTSLKYDQTEFKNVKWFEKKDVPLDRTDPNISRFLQKLTLTKGGRG